MQRSQDWIESAKSAIVEEINTNILKAIHIIEGLNNEDTTQAFTQDKIISKFNEINYNEAFKGLIDSANSLKNLLKEPYNKTRLLILGDTNVGKSTLSCELAGGNYFPTSNKAETYCTIRVYSETNYDARSFRIVVFGNKNNNVFKTEIFPETEKQCFEEIDKLKRENDHNSQQIELIEIYIKYLSHKSFLLDELIIQDTAGVSEANFSNKTYTELETYWNSSIILIVVDSGCGSLNLSSIDKLLSIFKKHNCTERIIFIFTKIISHIQECKPSGKEYKPLEKLELAINIANKTLESYQKQINELYPKAGFVFFDKDDEKWDEYYYNKNIMKYVYSKNSLNDPDHISIGAKSIEYLKYKINELTINSNCQMLIAQQQNKLETLKSLKAKMYTIITKNKNIIHKVDKFNTESKHLFDEAQAKFIQEINEKLDFDADKRKLDSPLREWIITTLNTLNELDHNHKRISKNNFIQYLSMEFSKRFNDHLHGIISDIYRHIFEDLYQHLITLIGEIERESQISNNPLSLHHLQSPSSRSQLIWALGGAAGSSLLFGGVALATMQTLYWAFGFQMTAAAATAMGIEATVAGSTIFLGGLSGIATLGIGFAIASVVAGIFYVTWTRNGVIEDLSKTFYEKIINDKVLKEGLENSGKKLMEDSYIKLKENSIGLFEPEENDLPGCLEYQEIESIIQDIQKSIDKLKEIMISQETI